MPDDKPQPLDELLENSEETPDEEQPEKKPPLRKIVTLGVIACVAVGAAWAAAEMLAAEPAAQEEPPENMVDENALPPDDEIKVREVSTSEDRLYTFEDTIVNLHGTEARRYLKTTIVFALKNPKLRKDMDDHNVQLLDMLNGVLSSKTIEDIDGFEKKQQLKRELRAEVNSLLGKKDAVSQVYFTEMIIQ
ncbi:MAG: flagellar basal body-associated FliL family protein [Planctomycetes bacterium]|nr:flagellar basal body-associated FliL family protein [Planctomycetota bacterium]